MLRQRARDLVVGRPLAITGTHKLTGGTAELSLGTVGLRADGLVLTGERRPAECSTSGCADGWLGATDTSGAMRWARSIGGGSSDDTLLAAVAMSDGGVVAVGSSDGWGAGGSDAWVVALDASGGFRWARALGTATDDAATAVVGVAGKVVVAGGSTAAPGAEPTGWLAAFGLDGTLLWKRQYGAMFRRALFRVLPSLAHVGASISRITLVWTAHQTGGSSEFLAVGQPEIQGNLLNEIRHPPRAVGHAPYRCGR